MADGEDDPGLELRLPWGPVRHPARTPAEPSAPVHPAPKPGAPRPAEPAEQAAVENGLVTFPRSSIVAPPPPAPPQPHADADSLRTSLDALSVLVEALLAAQQAVASAGSGQPVGDALLRQVESRVELADAGLQERLARLEALLVASHASTMRAVESAGGHQAEGPVVNGDTEVLDRRLERVEALVAATGGSSLDAMARVGEAVAGLEKRLEDVEVELHIQLERLDSAIGSFRPAVLQAIADHPSAELLNSLQASVMATGEHLDAELIDLKRLVAGQHLPH